MEYWSTLEYEYMTATIEDGPSWVSVARRRDAEMERDGWFRVWSDVTLRSVFAVYRR
jgi:hypothetical protein